MNPVGRRLWASVWYLLEYLILGWVLFAVAFSAVTVTLVLAVTLAGLPLLIALAATIRGCATVERARAGRFLGEPVSGRYRTATQPGLIAKVKAKWRDSATWRDVAYLVGVFIPLMTLDTVVVVVWLVLLAGITLPIWYWAPQQTFDNGLTAHGVQLGYFPNGPHGHPAYGVYVDTLPKALLAAAVFLILFLLFSFVVRITARAHAIVARALLKAPEDPLADAKEVLARPGPLPSL